MRLDHLLSRETRHPALEVELLRGDSFPVEPPRVLGPCAILSLSGAWDWERAWPVRWPGSIRPTKARPGPVRLRIGAMEGGGGAQRLRRLDLLRDVAEGVGL